MKQETSRWVAASASESLRRLGFVLVFAFISAIVIKTTLLLDLNKHVFDHKPGPCRQFSEVADNSVAYFEDVTSLGFLFASDGFQKHTKPEHNSSIFFLKYPSKRSPKNKNGKKSTDSTKNSSFSREEKKLAFKKLTIRAEIRSLADFTPLGIGSQIEGSVSQGRYKLHLYVINAPPNKNPTVEVFRFNPDQLTLIHQYTIKDAAFGTLSDIVVLGVGRFIVTNMFYATNRWMRIIEALSQREYGSLLLYDGKKTNRLVGGLQTPNGLFWDQNKRLLYVGLTLAETIKIYQLKPDFEISEFTHLNLMTSPDQLWLSETGDLWITAHTIAHEFLRVFFGSRKPAGASQVLRVRFQEKMTSWVITEPMASNGSTLSAASAITLIEDLLIVGGRIGKTIMCRVNDLTYA